MADTFQVQVMNDALFALGQEGVIDLEEASLGRSLAATKLMRVIEQARDTVLTRYGFTCALVYATLQAAALDVSGGVDSAWRYPDAYLLPADALRVWEVGDDTCTPVRWQAGTQAEGDGGRMLVRACHGGQPLPVAYVRRLAWGALASHVRDAISAELAARGCQSVTGDKTLAKVLAQTAEQKIMSAISTDGALEGDPPDEPSIPAVIRAYAR